MATPKSCILCHIPIPACYHGSPSDDGNGLNPELSVKSNSSFKSAQGLEKDKQNEDFQLINSFYRGIQIKGFTRGEVDRFLNGDGDHGHDQLSICEACKPVLTSTMKRKAVLDQVEENVRKMQLELLKELNKLKHLVHQFHDDMKGVKERIGSGGQSQFSSGSSRNSCEADLFGRRIRQVVKDLSSCQVNRLQNPEDPRQDELVSPISKDILKPSSPAVVPMNEEDAPRNQNQGDQEVSGDSDPDYDAKSSKVQNSPETASTSKNSGNRKTPDFNDVRSSNILPCKAYVINQVLLRKERILSGQPLPEKPGATTDVADPRDAYYIDYDSTIDSFSIDRIPISLKITSQKAFIFNCSQCPFRTGQTKAKEKVSPFSEILDHVLRLHRQVFRCSFCARICSSFTRYREHVRGHQMKYSCDICRKPFQKRNQLELHKRTHMKEQKREQAVKEGAKDPRVLLQLQSHGEDKPFQCRKRCGRRFQQKGARREHEKLCDGSGTRHGPRNRNGK